VIEISDDGRGMSPEKILAKARRQGLVSADASLDEESIFRLIFEPGFSTAEKVTDLSGRGVGMDVVRRQIQKLRGRISIRSVLGIGSTFVIRLPLTLAIIDGLVVGCKAQRFIVPMFAVREMFAPGPDTVITLENRAEAAHFRGSLYPIIRLSRLLCLQNELDAAESPESADATEIMIVVESRDQLFCIAVDQLIGKQEVVIKSLGKTFRDVPAISGGAILGDGRVGLIVDVNSLRSGRRD
jgi:two-component system chemotaxis sensor kinase CheA